MPVRTREIGAARNLPAGTQQLLFLVSADHTAIVKDVRCTNTTGGPLEAILSVRRAGVVYQLDRATVPAATTRAVTGAFMVLEPGDELLALVVAAGAASTDISWWVSGSLLEGVSE